MKRITLAAALLSACASTLTVDQADLLAAAMDGEYLSAPGQSGNVLLDRRVRLSGVEWEDGEWLYYQINRGPTHAAQDEVYRQRVLHLQARPDGSVAQTAYTLAEPETFAGLELSDLTKADLKDPFADGCELVWRGSGYSWSGAVDPETCVIFSERRQTHLRIGSRSEIEGDTLRQAESGYSMDGDYLWGSKDGDWITLERR